MLDYRLKSFIYAILGFVICMFIFVTIIYIYIYVCVCVCVCVYFKLCLKKEGNI